MGVATAVRERPILFSGEMVRAIIEGRKTVTRRVVKPQPVGPVECGPGGEWWDAGTGDTLGNRFLSGDRLWVKEAFRRSEEHQNCYYAADNAGMGELAWSYFRHSNPQAFRSIFMPRWASRITLEVVSVRVERVQSITQEDACAEGFDLHGRNEAGVIDRDALMGFRDLWERLNGPRGFGWDANPWVWRVEFRVLPPSP